MATPVFVTFRHTTPRAELEEYARERVGRLERLYGRVVDCRVLLEPSDVGVLRAVVELTVPGERLVASFEANDWDARPQPPSAPAPEYRWLHVMHEAFATAERVLQGYVGRRQASASV
jgi:hypothetical protein